MQKETAILYEEAGVDPLVTWHSTLPQSASVDLRCQEHAREHLCLLQPHCDNVPLSVPPRRRAASPRWPPSQSSGAYTVPSAPSPTRAHSQVRRSHGPRTASPSTHRPHRRTTSRQTPTRPFGPSQRASTGSRPCPDPRPSPHSERGPARRGSSHSSTVSLRLGGRTPQRTCPCPSPSSWCNTGAS